MSIKLFLIIVFLLTVNAEPVFADIVIGNYIVPSIIYWPVAVLFLFIGLKMFFAAKGKPAKSKYNQQWKFTCPRCEAENSDEQNILCENCEKGVKRAQCITVNSYARAYFGCSHCEKSMEEPKCSSCGAFAGNGMRIRGFLGWHKLD